MAVGLHPASPIVDTERQEGAPVEGSRSGSTLAAATWMVVLSVLLFWLPLLGPFLAGFVGGRKAVTVGKALIAALAPALIVAVLVTGVLAAFELPIIGAVAGIGLAIAVLVEDVPLFLGAWLGAATSR